MDNFPHLCKNLLHFFRRPHEISARSGADNLLRRAPHIDVNDIRAHRLRNPGGFSQDLWICAEELDRNRMLIHSDP